MFAGAALQVAAGQEKGTGRRPSLVRIQRNRWEVVGWSELAGSELAAAPEFGWLRGWRCGAREGELGYALGSWWLPECGDTLRNKLKRLQ